MTLSLLSTTGAFSLRDGPSMSVSLTVAAAFVAFGTAVISAAIAAAVGHALLERVVAGAQLAAPARDRRVDLEEAAGVDDALLAASMVADLARVGARRGWSPRRRRSPSPWNGWMRLVDARTARATMMTSANSSRSPPPPAAAAGLARELRRAALGCVGRGALARLAVGGQGGRGRAARRHGRRLVVRDWGARRSRRGSATPREATISGSSSALPFNGTSCSSVSNGVYSIVCCSSTWPFWLAPAAARARPGTPRLDAAVLGARLASAASARRLRARSRLGAALGSAASSSSAASGERRGRARRDGSGSGSTASGSHGAAAPAAPRPAAGSCPRTPTAAARGRPLRRAARSAAARARSSAVRGRSERFPNTEIAAGPRRARADSRSASGVGDRWAS